MTHFLTPVLALIVWTFIMMLVMYWRRIPAMKKVTKDAQEFIERPDLWAKIPPRVTWAADNYNHLHEQPVLFYALMFYLQLAGQSDPFYLYLAWAYVLLRVGHSLVQITSNKVMTRFGLFILSAVCLIIMTMRALFALL